jgi:Holliday junction resolvasome RuvABC ATP-dependent DNA helicase subunit
VLSPSQVFTLQIPVRPTNVYARRGDAEAQLDKQLKRGQVPLIFGEYGVGKTSMARVWSKAAETDSRLVNIESLQGKTLADIQTRILEVLGYRVKRSVERTASDSETMTVNVGFSGGPTSLPITLSGTKETASESGRTETDELVVTSPTDSKVLDLAEEAGLVLILDELHQASAEFRDHLTGFLKSYANKSCQRFRIILLGTASDATSLVRTDPGIDRLIQEVHLGAMTEQETEHLVREGMSALAINAESAIVHKIARTSAGSPAIAQYLALEVAEAAFARSPRKVAPTDLKSAIDSFVAMRAKRLNAVYVSAVETTGPRRYRKQVLRAIAESEDEYVSMENIRASVSGYVGEDVPSTALSGPLQQLRSSEYGAVLKDLERLSGTGRVFNRNTFADPAMKAFIRMRVASEEEGLL